MANVAKLISTAAASTQRGGGFLGPERAADVLDAPDLALLVVERLVAPRTHAAAGDGVLSVAREGAPRGRLGERGAHRAPSSAARRPRGGGESAAATGSARRHRGGGGHRRAKLSTAPPRRRRRPPARSLAARAHRASRWRAGDPPATNRR